MLTSNASLKAGSSKHGKRRLALFGLNIVAKNSLLTKYFSRFFLEHRKVNLRLSSILVQVRSFEQTLCTLPDHTTETDLQVENCSIFYSIHEVDDKYGFLGSMGGSSDSHVRRIEFIPKYIRKIKAKFLNLENNEDTYESSCSTILFNLMSDLSIFNSW